MRLHTLLAPVLVCTSALVIAACGGGSSGVGAVGPNNPNQPMASPSPAVPTAPPAPTPTPMTLLTGAVVGNEVFPAGDTATGGQGSPVDGIACDNAPIVFHHHSHLTLFHNGTQIAIPLAIGLMKPVYSMGGNFAEASGCFYHLHSHDNSGIIHIENPVPFSPTLGQYFDIWGEPLTTSNVAGFAGPTLFWIGTSQFSGDPRTIPLTDHEQITLEVGGPYVFPPFYTWDY